MGVRRNDHETEHSGKHATMSDTIFIIAKKGCCWDYYTQHQVRLFEVEVKSQGLEFSSIIILNPEPLATPIGSLVFREVRYTITQIYSTSLENLN